jgi:HAMP domain-containing protein
MTQNDRPRSRATFVSLRIKLLFIFTLLFMLAFAGVFLWFYDFATDLALEDLKRDLMATALSAAAGVDGDAHTELYLSGEIDDETYLGINAFLRSVKYTNPKAAGVYTYIQLPDEPETVRFVVSAALPPVVEPNERDLALSEGRLSGCEILPGTRPSIGAAYNPLDYTPEGGIMLNGVREAGVTQELVADDWGTWLSGFAPIYNSAGEPVGAVGVDMCAADVIQLQQSIRATILPAFGLTFLVLAAVVFGIAHSVTRPIIRLTSAAEGVGGGDYEQDFSGLYTNLLRDEVATLAQVFEMMVGKVREREQRLRQRVEELQIILDEGKRKKRVKEITESEFFRDLQSRARKMRARDFGEE